MKYFFFLWLGACGFGIGDDSGKPKPPQNYWGWQCADGTAPDPNSGCLPASCDDNSTPAFNADQSACLCADGSAVLLSSCSDPQGGEPMVGP
jgi:hypothetical protein